MFSRRGSFTILIFSSFLFLIQPYRYHAAVTDTIRQGQQLKDYEYLISAGGVFKLGFYTLGASKSRYLAISYNNHPDDNILFLGNRNTPISDSTGVFMLDADGKLKITYSRGSSIILNSDQIEYKKGNLIATLLDSGNFVLREANSKNETSVLWQSFDYPIDTLLPGMKLGVKLTTGRNWSLTSWASNDVPAPGPFTLGLDPISRRQLVIWRRGEVYWTSGIWQNNSEGFEFYPGLHLKDGFNFSYISNKDEIYFTYSTSGKNVSSFPMLMLTEWGIIYEDNERKVWPFGSSCNDTDPGCVENKKKEKSECRRSRRDLSRELHVGSMTGGDPILDDDDAALAISDCYFSCSSDCSCFAYASANGNGTGCLLWSRESSFIASDGGADIHFLVREGGKRKKWWIWLIVASIALVVLLLAALCYWMRNFRLKGGHETALDQFNDINVLSKDEAKEHKLKIFSFDSIVATTNKFSDENKLGEGGFGPVYKGKLINGHEVAVKRLSKSSGQGLVEFKNEITLIAKLQHKNLVRLLGYCIHEEEKILIYEYMANKSLDYFLFDPIRAQLLDWKKRLTIIEGIAQGLLYLHKYSRFKVIHRDLKASNVLLDNDMNPKISDFGMAKIFGHNESEANASKLVGTRGYISPEYAMEGIFSTKSDVYSFGVLLLEIVSGKKCTNSYHYSEDPTNLVGYAWMVWKEGKCLELMDPALTASCSEQQLLKFIRVGLLCVEAKAMDRPCISDVIFMIRNENILLLPPKQPAFSTERSITEVNPTKSEKHSLNGLSISTMEPR